MKTLNKFVDYQIDTIAIVDNDGVSGPEMMLPYWEVHMAGFKTIRVPRNLQSIPECIDFIQQHAQAVICSHRLGTYKQPSPFCGAELAASLYDAGIPTLLVTQYMDIDQHTSIRRWREKIPVVLRLEGFVSSTLKQNLDLCVHELQGFIPEDRLPYRVMLGVEHIEGVGDYTYVDVSIEIWGRHQRVRFPLALIPSPLREQIKPGSWLFAMTNVEAQYSWDLYFRNFVAAPEPECDDDMVYCVNVFDGKDENEHPLLWLETHAANERFPDIDLLSANYFDKDLFN